MSHRKQTAGISQLELMMSLTLMAMLTVIVANTMNYTRQALERASATDPLTQTALARETLRNWVEQIPLEYSGLTAVDHFQGDQGGFKFRALVHDQQFWAGALTGFTLVLDKAASPTQLLILTKGQSGPSAPVQQAQLVLASDVQKLKLSYYGRTSNEAEPKWHAQWADPIQLPLLVKVEWASQNGTPAPPLTLEAAKAARQRFMSLSSLVPPA